MCGVCCMQDAQTMCMETGRVPAEAAAAAHKLLPANGQQLLALCEKQVGGSSLHSKSVG